MPLRILYVDNHLLVVNKPAGLLVQGDNSGDATLLEYGKTYIKTVAAKEGNVFLGLVQRLDRPVSGVIVFARTSKAAARLSEQIRARQFGKKYWALLEGKVPEEGEYIDYLRRDKKRALPASPVDGQLAQLKFKRLNFHAGISHVEIQLVTGRYHQIRAQFSSRSFPIVGDRKYGAIRQFSNGAIALHAVSLTLRHPIREDKMTFTAEIDSGWQQFI